MALELSARGPVVVLGVSMNTKKQALVFLSTAGWLVTYNKDCANRLVHQVSLAQLRPSMTEKIYGNRLDGLPACKNPWP